MVLTADKVGNVLTSILMLVSRAAVDAVEPPRARNPRDDDESPCRLHRRHRRAADSLLRHGDHRRFGRLAAVLLSQTYYISPFGGLTPMIKGVSIALCGGLGSVRGAVIAAIVLGFNEALTSVHRRPVRSDHPVSSDHRHLLVRPRGIAGMLDRAREA